MAVHFRMVLDCKYYNYSLKCTDGSIVRHISLIRPLQSIMNIYIKLSLSIDTLWLYALIIVCYQFCMMVDITGQAQRVASIPCLAGFLYIVAAFYTQELVVFFFLLQQSTCGRLSMI